MTFRAVKTLELCDLILCEDTRITNRLLTKYHIQNKKLALYNENSNQNDREKILGELKTGSNIALVSDAGTPLISDPGYKLIAFLRQNNIKITPIPGASALTAALSTSGIATDNFIFLGFPPNSSQKRQNFLKNLPKSYNLAFYESPKRIFDTLSDIYQIFGDVKVAIARELTKIHEEIISDKISKIIEFFKENPQKIRGEFVLIIEKPTKIPISEEKITQEIEKSLKNGQKIKEISQNIAEIYDLNKKEVYQMALKLQNTILK